MAMSELKRRLLKIELARLGFRNAKYSEEQDVFLVDPADSQTMRISDNGTVLFYALHEYLGHEVREMALRVNEIIAAWENAPAVPFEDISHFRILSEYNNIVLAARDDSELGYGHGLYYVTWRYSYGRTGFEHGNYTEDYAAAKEDFAVRCGLIDKSKLFDETEMTLIRQGLVHLGANFPDLSAEQMTILGKVVGRIEMLVPDIRAHEELEHQKLAPEDGLEI